MASAEDYAAWIVNNQDKKGSPEFETVAQAYREAKGQTKEQKQERSTGEELLRQGGLTLRAGANAVAGIPAMLTDAVTGVANQFLPEGNRFQAQLPALNRQLTAWGLPAPENATERVAGDVASAMGGAGGLAKTVPAFSDRLLTQIFSAGTGQGASSITRENGGGGLAQFLAGLAGSSVPIAAQAAARGVFPNLTQAGRDDTKGRLLNQAAGGQKKDVLAGLDAQKSYVKGEQPTAAQAAVDANAPAFAAMENEVLRKFRPDVQLSRDQANEAARLGAVREISGPPGALDKAFATREANAQTNYGKAYSTLVNSDPELRQIFKDPFIRKEVPDALELLKGQPVGTNLTQFLQNVKIGLDQKLAKTGNDSLSSAQKAATQESKDQLLAWLDKRNPAYQTARETFAQESVPINQMQVGQFLEGKLKSPLTGSERPAGFAQALSDAPRSIKSPNGTNYDLLSDVLSKQQIDKAQGVKSSLERDSLVNSQAKLGSQVAKGLLGEKEFEAPQLLNRAVSATRFVLEKIGVSTKNKSLSELAMQIQDPPTVARLMREATPSELAAIQQVLKATTPAAALGNMNVRSNGNPNDY